MGTWTEQYNKVVHGQASMLRLLRCGMAAAKKSGNAVLCSKIAAERFVAPLDLCEALDACGVPGPLESAAET